MRLLKLSLIIALVLVTALFAYTQLDLRLSGRTVGPQITCPTEILEISVHDPEAVLYSGITATDKQDGDLTDRVQILSISKLISDDVAKVTYLVFDNDGNMKTLTRQIRYRDYRLPRFVIKEPLVYTKNEPVALLDRLAVSDVIDGDISNAIRVSALAATTDSEIYTASLQVTNSMGDTTRVTVPVLLLETTAARPVVHLKDQLVYLESGSSFRALDYLQEVVCPIGQADLNLVQISGEVDTQTPGTYMVYYRYPFNGSTGIAVLTVVVQ